MPTPDELLTACLLDADPAAGRPPLHACARAHEAIELAAGLGREDERARAAVWACIHLLRLGQYGRSLEQALIARPWLELPERLGLRRDLLRLISLAGSETGEFATALEAANELLRLSTRDGSDGTSMQAIAALAGCCERMGDSWQAVRLLSTALADKSGDEPRLIVLLAANGLCATCIGIMHRLLDAGEDAEAQAVMATGRAAAEQALALLDPLQDPIYEIVVNGNLAEVLLYQGELDAARPLLALALERASQRNLTAYTWRIRATQGSLLLASGDPAGALAAMEQVLEQAAPDAPQQTITRVRHVAYRACRALGRFEQALAHLEVFERSEGRRAMAQLRAQSQLFVTRTEAQHALWQAEQARLDAEHHRVRAAEFAASAERDPLTGLGNRRHFDRRCAELFPAAERDARPLALAVIDVDHFKEVNDERGHAAGDRVLQGLAQLLRENTRARDIVARHGGEEFVVVLPGLVPERATEFCERLLLRVSSNSWSVEGPEPLHLTISIGLATAGPYDAALLMAQADDALFRAKRGGRNRLERAAA